MAESTSLADFSAETIDGEVAELADYEGQVVLVVNTASQCGFTPQYAGLQKLQEEYGDRGFTVLGFPCDQFGGQEPGDNAEIADFCESSFGVTFPMFGKVDVNGKNTHELWSWLKSEQKGLINGAIKWNFTKFLIGKDGKPVSRFAPKMAPEAIAGDIEKLL